MLQPIASSLFTFSGMWMGRVYLIDEPDGCTLVDTGVRRSGRRILAALERLGRPRERLKHILITHAHPDHTGGLDALVRATGAAVYASEGDRPVIEGRVPMAGMVLPGGVRFELPSGSISRTKVDRVLEDGDIVPVFGGLAAIETPGHTIGHLAYWQPERRVLFAGDCVIRFPAMRPPFRPFTPDPAANFRSMARLAELHPEVVCFGHGAPLIDPTRSRFTNFIEGNLAQDAP